TDDMTTLTFSVSVATRDTDSNNYPTALQNLFVDALSYARTDVCPRVAAGTVLRVTVEAYPVGGLVRDMRRDSVSCP
ncbi:MAG TPA: hypothetical protein VFV50_07610, partial [Bdellovibrionales bacterium]|nr:hypothetical protein [Bdellovibrionales bacterium]